MVAYLSGKIVLERPGFVIVEAAGLGYKIHSSDFLGQEGETVKLFVHHHIREEAEDLYGFQSYEKLELFEKLISVNGVGPKVALGIMHGQDEEKITSAIMRDDVGFFQAIPGIGKKVAAKIILDLKSKITKSESQDIIGKLDKNDEILEAMASLGYKNVEILKIIPKIPVSCASSEDKVKWLLKNIKR